MQARMGRHVETGTVEPTNDRVALVMLTRWMRGRPVFTDRDWLFLLGHNRDKSLSLRLWLRFVKLWFAVVFVGLAIGYYLSPYGAGWLVGALIVAGAAALFIAPKWLR